MKYFRVVSNDDLYEKVLVKCKNESLSISAYLRRLIVQDIRHAASPPKSKPEAILYHLNRKAKSIISRAFYATPVNLSPIELLLKPFNEKTIKAAIDKAIERKFTKEQLDPEVFFLPENFEKLLEETKTPKTPAKKIEKAAANPATSPAKAKDDFQEILDGRARAKRNMSGFTNI